MNEHLTPHELVQIVTNIMNAHGTEQEIDEWLNTFMANVPHPQAVNLIFHPDRVVGLEASRDLTAAKIVTIALAYQLIQLPIHRHNEI
jgi:Colicin immunity protein / pyocin immunity protein